jgi:hypothetical protein
MWALHEVSMQDTEMVGAWTRGCTPGFYEASLQDAERSVGLVEASAG